MAEEKGNSEKVNHTLLKDKITTLVEEYKNYITKLYEFDDYVECAFNKSEQSALSGNKAKFFKNYIWGNHCSVFLDFYHVFNNHIDVLSKVISIYENFDLEVGNIEHNPVDYTPSAQQATIIDNSQLGMALMPGQDAQPPSTHSSGNPSLAAETNAGSVGTISIYLSNGNLDLNQTNAFVTYGGTHSAVNTYGFNVSRDDAIEEGPYQFSYYPTSYIDFHADDIKSEGCQILRATIMEWNIIVSWNNELRTILDYLETNREFIPAEEYNKIHTEIENLYQQVNGALHERKPLMEFLQKWKNDYDCDFSRFSESFEEGDPAYGLRFYPSAVYGFVQYANTLGFNIKTPVSELEELLGLNIGYYSDTTADVNLTSTYGGRIEKMLGESKPCNSEVPMYAIEAIYAANAATGSNVEYTVMLDGEQYTVEGIPTEEAFSTIISPTDNESVYDRGDSYISRETICGRLSISSINNSSNLPYSIFKITNSQGESKFVTADYFDEYVGGETDSETPRIQYQITDSSGETRFVNEDEFIGLRRTQVDGQIRYLTEDEYDELNGPED